MLKISHLPLFVTVNRSMQFEPNVQYTVYRAWGAAGAGRVVPNIVR